MKSPSVLRVSKSFRVILPTFLVILLAAGVATASVPTQVTYQGQLKVGADLWTGPAQMKFAIVDGTTSLWSNDSTSVAGGQPSVDVNVAVVGGVFTVPLGAPPMKPLTPGVFAAATSAVLRVWASTGGAFEQLIPDQPLSSVPFALQAAGSQAGTGWTEDGGGLYHVGGNVGIGTSTPTSVLDVGGRIQARANSIGEVSFRAINSDGVRNVDLGSYGGGPTIKSQSHSSLKCDGPTCQAAA